MTINSFNIIWTKEAENDLDIIYDFYSRVSVEIASKIIGELVLAVEEIVFAETFQVDEINSHYRRVVVRHYKILYREVNKQIVVFAVFDCRQDPQKLSGIKS